MAIYSVNETSHGRTGNLDFTHERTYVRKFRVLCDSDTDGPLNATSHVSIPTVGVPYITSTESDPLARVKSVEPAMEGDDPRVWIVTVNYDTKFDTKRGGGGSGTPGAGGAAPDARVTNPLLRPIEWEMDWVEERRAIFKDKDSKVFKNTAGQLFSPPYEEERSLTQITAVKNYASYSYNNLNALKNKVNDAVWLGFDRWTVRVKGIKAKSVYENNTSFVQVTWAFMVDPEAWNPTRLLSHGSYQLVAGVPTPKSDGIGGYLADILLDATGLYTTTPYYKEFRNYDTTSFASIP